MYRTSPLAFFQFILFFTLRYIALILSTLHLGRDARYRTVFHNRYFSSTTTTIEENAITLWLALSCSLLFLGVLLGCQQYFVVNYILCGWRQ